jgi:anti-sigma-K factor RskA
MTDHDHIEELLAVAALGGMSGPERAELDREMAAHGECDTCVQLRREAEQTAGALALTLEPEPLSPGLVDRIVSEAERERPRAPVAESPRRRSPWLVPVAAALVALVVGLAVGVRVSGDDDGESLAAFLSRPGVQVVAMEGTGPGRLSIAVDPNSDEAYVFGSGLESPPEGSVMELWAFAGETPVGSGCMTPVDGELAVPVVGDFATSDLMAITIEPSGCPQAPTTDPIFVGALA